MDIPISNGLFGVSFSSVYHSTLFSRESSFSRNLFSGQSWATLMLGINPQRWNKSLDERNEIRPFIQHHSSTICGNANYPSSPSAFSFDAPSLPWQCSPHQGYQMAWGRTLVPLMPMVSFEHFCNLYYCVTNDSPYLFVFSTLAGSASSH